RPGPGPVEAGARGAALQLECALPLRESTCDPGQDRGIGITGRLALPPLDLVPLGLVSIAFGATAFAHGEHVRVTANHLVGDRARDLVEVESALLLRH